VTSLTPSPETPTGWEALPEVVRRSFDLFLTRFQGDSPGSSLSRSGEPTEQGLQVVVPFRDATSGASYEVSISRTGRVSGTRRVG
jgi:hypothetical protein